MKQLLVAIHGNPGTPNDFDSVIDLLKSERKILRFRRPAVCGSLAGLVKALDEAVEKEKSDEIIIVAYSWGAYLALQWASATARNIKKIVLVNPTLRADSPLSPAVGKLTGVPLVGDFLLKKISSSKTEEFIKHSFAPVAPAKELEVKLIARISDPSVWKAAIQYKLLQQNNPLSACKMPIQVAVEVIRGVQDEAIQWVPQRDLLNSMLGGNAKYKLHEIAGAGHALPWTHPAQIAEIIENDTESVASARINDNNDKLDVNVRIGYQSGETINNNITCYLERHLERFPDRPAIRWADADDIAKFDGNHLSAMRHHSITYEQFGDGIRRVAKGLRNLGISKGDRVILFLPMSVGMYTAMCAIQRIGAIAVFLDSWARRTHLGASAECVNPKAMISHKAAFDLVAQVPEFSNMKLRIIAGPGNDGSYNAQLEALFKSEPDYDIAAVESETTALITFTTGSSGKPKGANRTHRFLAAQHEALWDVIPYDPIDSDMPAFPIFSLNNLASGVTTVLPAIDLAKPNENDPAALVSQILHDGITCTTLSPSMLNNVSAFCITNSIDLPGLRRVVTGGAPISKDNVRDFRSIAPKSEIWILYGSTEVEPMAHIEAAEMLSLEEDEDPEIIESGVNVGHISEELRYKFIKPTHEDIDFSKTSWSQLEVPKGSVGEFIVTGDHVCQDYYNNPEAFFKTKIKDTEGAVWHRTGDLAYSDDRGYLWVVGRIHNMINRSGEYFFPVSAEIILKRFDFVKRGAFLGFPDEKLGERTAVVIEVIDGYTDITSGIKEIQRVFEKNRITIDSVYIVDAIPMDPRHHSKVEYAALRESIIKTDCKDFLA